MHYNRDGIDTIFSVLQKEYETEELRNKHLETKVQVLLAVSGVLAPALMLLFKSIVESDFSKILDIVLLSISLTCLVSAMICFLLVFKIKVFNQIAYKELISPKALHQESHLIKYNLAHDYYACTRHNVGVGNSKVKFIKVGSILIIVSILVFSGVFGHFAFKVIDKERSKMMAKDSTTKSGTSTPTPSPKTDRGAGKPSPSPVHESNNQGPGYGTQPIEKSERGGKQ